MDWPKDVLKKNDIVPLNLFVAYCINQTLSSCETFVAAITKQIKFMPSFCPGHYFFMRSPNLTALNGISHILNGNPNDFFTPALRT